MELYQGTRETQLEMFVSEGNGVDGEGEKERNTRKEPNAKVGKNWKG